MKKRLVVKMAVAITALSAMTLLQGCGDDDGGMGFGAVWMPVMPGVNFGGGASFMFSQGSTAGAGQSTGSTAGGAAAAAGGGNQVSSGAVF